MNYLKLFFNPRGRIRRLSYFLATIICTLSFYVPTFLSIITYDGSMSKMEYYDAILDGENIFHNHGVLFAISSLAIYILAVVSLVFIKIKRFRDINMNGFWVLSLLIPLLNIVIALKLFFTPSANHKT